MQAFLFDLDGVLIDTESVYSRIWSDIESHFPTGIENFARVIKGTTLESILSNYFSAPDVRRQAEAMLHAAEERMTYDLCPGAAAMLAGLKSRGVPVALVTSSDDEKMRLLAGQQPELVAAFDVVIDGSQVERSKPDPQGYLMAAGRLGVSGERCVVVEDSLQGVKAGKAAGAYVIGVAGTLPREEIKPYCDIVVDSLEELDLDAILSEREG